MSKPGPESILTKELTLQIREHILDGKQHKQIQEILEIKPGTWDKWYYENYKDFRSFVNDAIFERRVRKAGYVIEATMDDKDKRLSLDAAKFTAETLGKQHYSKKTETDITSNGESLGVVFLPNKQNNEESST